MRVLELGKHYPPSRGGMETSLRQLCLGLRRHGHRVFVLVSAEGRWPSAERQEGISVRRLARWGQIRSMPLTPALPAALRRARRTVRPERVHLHLPNPGMTLGWCLFGDPRIPLVISYHSDIVRQRWLGRLLEPLRQRLLRRAACILVSSRALLEASESLRPHRERCHVVPFGVQLPPDRHLPGEDRGEPYFLFVGRLVYYKGLEVLLEAMVGTEARLVVVGEGPRRAAMESLARRKGIQERVRFVGDRDPEELQRLYRNCRALVLPSVAPSETFGLVQLEAMASGRPVIASRASGGMVSVHRENETALLVPPADPAALREALCRLWEDPALADSMGSAAREHVRRHFGVEKAQDESVALLEGCGA